jgi:hypothetical protein
MLGKTSEFNGTVIFSQMAREPAVAIAFYGERGVNASITLFRHAW